MGRNPEGGQVKLKFTTMLKTNSSQYRNNIYTYLLDSIDGTEFQVKTDTPSEKMEFFFKTFLKEFIHKNNQHLPIEKNLAEWLSGLPSVIDLPFYNGDILKLAKSLLETDNLSEDLEDKIIENYYNHMALHLIYLSYRCVEDSTIRAIIEFDYQEEMKPLSSINL